MTPQNRVHAQPQSQPQSQSQSQSQPQSQSQSQAQPKSPAQLRGLRPGDLGWVIGRHGALYAQEYGFDQRFEALVARIAADYVERLDAGRECAWMAELEGQALGCVFLVQARDDITGRPDPGVAQLRLLLVEPQARGHGLGRRLTAQCEAFARGAGYTRLRLWTNQSLSAARAIYLTTGYRLLASEAHQSFGNVQVGEVWEKALAGTDLNPSQSHSPGSNGDGSNGGHHPA